MIVTVKCVAESKFNPVETWNSFALWISFLTYSAGDVAYAYTVLCHLAAAIKLHKRKNS